MFSKFKSSSSSTPNVLESNPICKLFEIGKQCGTAGPENVWRILEGYRKSDRQEVSIFVFDKRSVEKIHKPKRKEMVTKTLRDGVQNLDRFQNPKTLQLLHPIEECPDTLAFVSEPVLASLANVLAYVDQKASEMAHSASSAHAHGMQSSQPHNQSNRTFIKEYDMVDMEITYGLQQMNDALSILHGQCQLIHRNICPSSIIITKRGTWKLFGFEFVVQWNGEDPSDLIELPQWTTRLSKMTQPNLDYTAPEIQLRKVGSVLSDMFSFGMVVSAIFNNGRPLIQANHTIQEYGKQLELIGDHLNRILARVPVQLQEMVSRTLQKDTKQRPTAQILSLTTYFRCPAVQSLQFLDIISMKTQSQKAHFFINTLKESLPLIPQKLWFQHIWPHLQSESRSAEVFAAVLQPMLYIIQHSSIEQYEQLLLPSFSVLFNSPKSVQGTVVLLENLHIILEKTPQADIPTQVLPILFKSFETNKIQIQTAAFVAVANVADYLDDTAIRKIVLPNLRLAFNENAIDQRILMNAVSRILDQLEKQHIIEDVLPILWEIKLQEPEIILRVISIYKMMLTNKEFGLSVDIMATRIMPSLLPQTVNSALNLDHFTLLIGVLQEMLNQIQRHQTKKLKFSNLPLPSPERRTLRHQFSTENMNVQPFNIPGVRIDQRKTSSAEDMARKNSIGSSILMTASAENMSARKNSMFNVGNWLLGSISSANNDNNNYLKVENTFQNRRLSDNTLMTPKIRIAPSCASSPGGTPGAGLPTRRHSSTCQERRGSNVNLSPPTGWKFLPGGLPITSSSVPQLLSSSMNSIRSRRPSVLSSSAQQGSGIIHQLGSGMVRQLPPICLNLNGPPPPPTLSPSFQPSGQPSH